MTQTVQAATSADETPVFFPAAGQELFGIFTRPTTEPSGIAAVLLSGGSWVASAGRNRIWARLARGLAERGFATMRFDYRGVGDSTGALTEFKIEEPLTEDVEGAIAWIRGQQLSEFVLLGTCFGGRTALAMAKDVPGIRGVALFGSPVRDFQSGYGLATLPPSWYLRKAASRRALAGLFDPRKRQVYVRLMQKKVKRALGRADRDPAGRQRSGFHWVSPLVIDALNGLIDMGVPVLFVYGREDPFLHELEQGRAGALGKLLQRAGDLVTIDVIEGKVHGLTTGAVQEQVIRCTERWLERVSPTTGGAT